MPLYREASLADLPSICILGEQVNVLHHEAWPNIFAEPGDPMRHASHWQHSIEAEQATTFLCEHERSVVGFVTIFIAKDPSTLLQPAPYARVGSISVAPEHRGQGIGSELMYLAERWAHGRGVSDLRLHVWAFNERALGLYTELGYEVRSHVLGKRLRQADA
jgi:ribosomal protein S18 acetylase RimI-like enzyme